MSDLVSRLRGIARGPGRTSGADPSGAPGGPERPARQQPAPRELTYEPERPSGQPIDPGRVADALGGEPLGEGRAAFVRVRRRYEPDRRHGEVRISACGCDRVDLIRLLDPSVDTCAAPLLFFDLETTGLSGGAGTLAFLVGCAWFEDGALQLEQYLLTSYAAERALLAHFAERVAACGMLVSYNGRTFDAPLLEMRWQFHRSRAPIGGTPHADMLHPARRLWRTRACDPDGGCSLATLERFLFGVERVNDVPGFEIPSRYFRFLRSGDPAPLEPILEHNRMDLVSLAAVTARGLALVDGGSAECRDGWERLALGRLLERHGDAARAMECFGDATNDPSRDVRVEALARIAARHRRARRHAEAADAWQQVFALAHEEQHGNPRTQLLARDAAEALAVHHEHRARNLAAARELARKALALERSRRGVESLQYRLQRLERKMGVQQKSGDDAAPLLD